MIRKSMSQETQDSLNTAIDGFMKHDGPARVMFDPRSQKAFLKTYTNGDMRAAAPQYEPFQILAQKDMGCFAL